MNGSNVEAGDSRLWRFLHKPWQEKLIIARNRWTWLISKWTETISNIPVLVQLPFGALWLARNDSLGRLARKGQFEVAELAFADRFLQPGMTVLDIGANHGFYTLLASKRVGRRGKVVAFEPSPREKKALRIHLFLNRCRNVDVQGLALGEEDAESEFYLVEAWAAGCNSLRPPDVPASTTRVPVHVTRLDDWLRVHNVGSVDFVKMDVEGGELSALKGAETFLERRPRPVILAEVQEIRTKPWGYHAKEIIKLLSAKGFRWFSLSEDGSLGKLDEDLETYEGNFVAWPTEVELTMPELGSNDIAELGEL